MDEFYFERRGGYGRGLVEEVAFGDVLFKVMDVCSMR